MGRLGGDAVAEPGPEEKGAGQLGMLCPDADGFAEGIREGERGVSRNGSGDPRDDPGRGCPAFSWN